MRGLVFFTVVLAVSLPASRGEAEGLSLVGEYRGGLVRDIHLRDGYGIAAAERAITVFRLDDPSGPVPVASLDLTTSRSLALRDDGLAYVARAEQGISVVDFADPLHPVVVGELPLNRNPVFVYFHGDRAYVGADDGTVHVLDVSDPRAPIHRGSYVDPCIGCWHPTDIVAVGDLVYVAGTRFLDANEAVVQVLDAVDPAAPFKVDELVVGGTDPSMERLGDKLYVTDGWSRILTLDISGRPPVVQHELTIEEGTRHLAQENGTLFVAGGARDHLTTLILDAEGFPRPAGGLELRSPPSGLAVSGGRAYVPLLGRGLMVVDVSDLQEPVSVGTFERPSDGGVVVDSGRLLVLGTDGWLLDISDPLQAVEAARTRLVTWDGVFRGDLAFLASGDLGLRILNISDLNHPTLVGEFSTSPDHALNVSLADNTAFLKTSGAFLQVVDITRPDAPGALAVMPGTEGASRSVHRGGTLVVSIPGLGLRFFDITSPSNPRELGTWSPQPAEAAEHVNAVALGDGIAYVPMASNGVAVVDWSNPLEPREINRIVPPGLAGQVRLVGNVLYVAAINKGIYVVDVTDPLDPQQLAFESVASDSWGFDVADGVVSVMISGDGLRFYRAVPTPVTNLGFTAAWVHGEAVVRWMVGDATDHLGFRLHREHAEAMREPVGRTWHDGAQRYAVTDHEASPGGGRYWLEERTRSGAPIWHGPAILGPAPGVHLGLAEPNPFREATVVSFHLETSGSARVAVFDAGGRVVAVLVQTVMSTGTHRVSWSGHNASGRRVPAGTYYIQVSTPLGARSVRVLRLR